MKVHTITRLGIVGVLNGAGIGQGHAGELADAVILVGRISVPMVLVLSQPRGV